MCLQLFQLPGAPQDCCSSGVGAQLHLQADPREKLWQSWIHTVSPGAWLHPSTAVTAFPRMGGRFTCVPHISRPLWTCTDPFTCWGRSGPGDEGPPEVAPRLLLSLSMGMGRLCSVGGKGRDIRWVQEQGHHCQTEMGMGSLDWGEKKDLGVQQHPKSLSEEVLWPCCPGMASAPPT